MNIFICIFDLFSNTNILTSEPINSIHFDQFHRKQDFLCDISFVYFDLRIYIFALENVQ